MNNQNFIQNYNLEFKLILIREESIGKTSLIFKVIKNRFEKSSNFSTYIGSYLTTQFNLFSALSNYIFKI